MSAPIQRAAEALRASVNRPLPTALIGFDGFCDEIMQAVDSRQGVSNFKPMEQICQLAARIGNAAGKSTNVELIPRDTKIGGNGPILAAALVASGHPINLVGCLGDNSIAPLFQPLASSCSRAISLGPPGHSFALEFQDGKIILGVTLPVLNVSWQQLIDTVGLCEFIQLVDASKLIASTNWTMIPAMTQMWHEFSTHVAPLLSKQQEKRFFFVDLADPSKRSDQDLQEAISALQKLEEHFQVVLGLNFAESLRLCHLLQHPSPQEDGPSLEQAAIHLQRALHISQVVIHATTCAAAATAASSAWVDGPYCPDPKLTTGAGDNFNGGYCSALMRGLAIKDALFIAVATSGYYVRFKTSPTPDALHTFLTRWSQNLPLDAQ